MINCKINWYTALVGTAILLSSYNTNATEVPVYVAHVEMRNILPTDSFPGRVISDNYIQLAAQVSGKLTQVSPLGSYVEKGEVIAQIDDTLFQITVQKSKQTVNDIKVQREQAISERDRLDTLTSKQYTSVARLEQLDTQIKLIDGKLKLAKLNLDEQSALLNRTRITAPFSGQIAQRSKKAGEWIESSKTVISMIDTKQLEVSLIVPSEFANQLRNNDEVSVNSSKGVIQGYLRTKVPQPDFKFYELRVSLSTQELDAGLSVNVGFPKQGFKLSKVVVPRDALQIRNGALGVFRINAENRSEYVSVKTIAIDNGWSAVEGELKSGDTIVIRGVESLTHGQDVRIIEPEVALVDHHAQTFSEK